MIRSDSEIALLMLAAGFPPTPQVIAEGIGVVHAESGGDDKNNSQNPGGAIGLWSEEPNFEGGSTAERLNALSSTKLAHSYWKTGKWNAWAPYETGETEGTGPSRAPKYIGTASRSINAAKTAGRKQSVGSGHTANVDLIESIIGGAESLLEGGLLEQGPAGKNLGGSGALAEDTGEAASGIGGGILGPIIGPITTIGEVFKVVGELLFTPEGWLRIGKMIGGAMLFVWGLDILVRQSSAAQSAKSAGIGLAMKVAEVA